MSARTAPAWALMLALIAAPPVLAETIYIHVDHLGSPIMKTDQQGNVVWEGDYGPRGGLILLGGTATAGPGYTGHYHDQGTGLIYMQQRYYDPEAGRFMSTDSDPVDIATAWNFNRYSYAANNPYANIDPDGRRCIALNAASPYCARRYTYLQYDGGVRDATRFFGAAAATVEYLANGDIRGAGWLSGSSEARQFLHTVSSDLYALNAEAYSAIRDGSLSGPGLDAQLVHMEQTRVQQRLDALPAEQRSSIVSSINAAFARRILRRAGTFGSASDARYHRVLNRVEENLGRSIDFGRQSDREAIGNELIKDIRKSGACSSTGTRIRSC